MEETRAMFSPNSMAERPLFIPLRREWFEAFESGDKTEEHRRHGKRWNARTCRIGRAVTLSLGYSGRRLTGVITSFGTRLCDAECDGGIYRTGEELAVIGITLVDPSRIAPPIQRELRKHCWHNVGGISVGVFDGTYRVRCCWCGAEGERSYRLLLGSEIGHGPYAAQYANLIWDPMDDYGPCLGECRLAVMGAK